MNVIEPTPSQAAVVLKKFLSTNGCELQLSVAQEALARTRGYASFQAYVANVAHRGDKRSSKPAAEPPPVQEPAIVGWVRQESQGPRSLEPAFLWMSREPLGYNATYRPVTYADGPTVRPPAPFIEGDERIFTVKLKGVHRSALVALVEDAHQLAKLRARDTTPLQEAEESRRARVYAQALSELKAARCYEEESAPSRKAARAPAPASMPSGSPYMKLWAVSGRTHGADDDTVVLLWAKTEDEARVEFKLRICEYSDLPEVYAFEEMEYPIYVCSTKLVGEYLPDGRFALARDLWAPTKSEHLDISRFTLEEIEGALRLEYEAHEDYNNPEKGSGEFEDMLKRFVPEPRYSLHEAAKRYLELTAKN